MPCVKYTEYILRKKCIKVSLSVCICIKEVHLSVFVVIVRVFTLRLSLPCIC